MRHEKRKWKVVTTSFPQLQSGLSVFWKLCLNLCSRRWLSPSHSLVISFTPIVLWQPKIVFAVGLMNLRIFDLKTLSVSELRMILESNLFHSIMVDGEYEFLKNWFFTLIWGIFCAFIVLYWQLDCAFTVPYWQLDCGIISERYFRHWLLHILKKRHSFLYQRLCWRDSKPNFCFSLELTRKYDFLSLFWRFRIKPHFPLKSPLSYSV